ncbi:hypothetical protein SAMN04489730_6286 [Amycolatopsis australiensis]|uniref:Uncharacterized protein n=1 Tax=Amycolatopsis australiensis TaxID=546364 RepID=A0A1K1SP05_9PSEU|nr:hypothetical protein SAMN04489730_6286 [Amycolatopsis australiensis]
MGWSCGPNAGAEPSAHAVRPVDGLEPMGPLESLRSARVRKPQVGLLQPVWSRSPGPLEALKSARVPKS